MSNPKTIIDAIELFKVHLKLIGCEVPVRISLTPPTFELFLIEIEARNKYANIIPFHGRFMFSGILFGAEYRDESEKRRQITTNHIDKMINELKEVRETIKKI